MSPSETGKALATEEASFFRPIVEWDYSYLVTVLDDYSRFILAQRLNQDLPTDRQLT